MDLTRLISQLGPAGKQGGRSRQQRLYDLLKQAILQGALREGTALPGTRQIALEHGISRNSVIFAYEQLRAEGFVITDRRQTRVARLTLMPAAADQPSVASIVQASLSTRSQRLGSTRLGSGHLPFATGIPDLNLFPWGKWLKHLERAWKAVGARHLAYSAAGGEPRLRQAIATQLSVARGLPCSAEQVLITSGAQMAIDLCGRMLADQGDTVWMENPGYPSARAALGAAGLHLIEVPVDGAGMAASPALWQQHPPRLVFVTPSYQYPMGSVMPLERRLELLENARRHRSWIIEDDYDSDLQHNGSPLPAIQSLAPHVPVVYIGTFSKSLYPGLRLGYMVVPASISTRMAAALQQLFPAGQVLDQLALAGFIESGDLARHLRNMRTIYRQRQHCLRQCLETQFGDEIEILGGQAGVHLTVVFKRQIDDRALAAEALALGVTTRPLSDYGTGSPTERPCSGLVLGYGVADEKQIENLVPRLRQAFAAVTAAVTTPA